MRLKAICQCIKTSTYIDTAIIKELLLKYYGNNIEFLDNELIRSIINNFSYYKVILDWTYEYDTIYTKRKNKIEIKNIKGVYFLFREDTIVFIGKSNNILNALSSQVKYRDFDSISFSEANDEIARSILENYYVKKFNPVENKLISKYSNIEFVLNKAISITEFEINKDKGSYI